MKVGYYFDNGIPYFEAVNYNRNIPVKSEAMISCDLTIDNNNILCAYHSEEKQVSVSVFNTNLDLILTKKYGQLSAFTGEDFIKILYFKDNSVFVMIYTQSNTISRLAYFSYLNNNINDKLYQMTKSSSGYLDIQNSQSNGNYGSNDIMVADSNKIIKIFGNDSGNNIIITIIQFYNNDSSMSIKIYNMINNNGFNYLKQSRISMLKNSLVFCASAIKNNVRRPGYSIINYPNSVNVYLLANRIVIKDLIKLENQLFSIEEKFKILNIPRNFSFVRLLDSTEVKVNDEFVKNDQLILKKYRVNEGEFILNFQSLARGYDSGYTSCVKYPSNANIKDNEVLIEGKPGYIIIDFKDCLTGYYHIENINNICTNEKPKGYYLDEKNKI